jgi:hypothetical protein
MDFEEACRLRDQISLLRAAGLNAVEQKIDTRGLSRQQPGAMGLGTSRQQVVPPSGWCRPVKPDPLTKHKSTRGKRR